MSEKKQDMCNHCGKVKDVSEGTYIYDRLAEADVFICTECFDKYYYDHPNVHTIKCDLCGNLFSEENVISVTYKDGHKSNLCEGCDGFIDHFNELGFEYPVTPEHIKDVLARYPAEDPRTDDFDMSKLIHKHTPDEPRTDAHPVDIHKIIDDAMAKGDRSVSIMMHDGITSVEVRPYVEEKVQWIHTLSDALVCSDCGHILTDYIGPIPVFCGHCGEKMHGVREEITD